MNNFKLEKNINKYLNSKNIKDISINGLQIEGKNEIKKIILIVSIYSLIIKKIDWNKFDTIICHHGLFWKKNNKNIIGIKKKIIKKIIKNNINVFCWHLPLDINNKIGNNIELIKKLKIKIQKIWKEKPFIIGKSNIKIKKIIEKKFKNYKFIKSKNKNINKIGLCTGSGEKFIEKLIIKYNIDTYITGEISEKNIYMIYYYDINLFLLGHDNSEIYGLKKLGIFIKNNFNLYTKLIK